MSQIRREVLNAFKKLHRTREFVFQGDARALIAGRQEINENFQRNKYVQDENEIKNMLKLAQDVDKELRTSVIQAVEKEDGVYALRFTDETTRLDNAAYNPDVPSGCCGSGECGNCGCEETAPTPKQATQKTAKQH